MSSEESAYSNILQRLATGIAQSEYSLLLGAGVSVDTKGGNGLPLPTGTGLTTALVDEFMIDTAGDPITLAQAYNHVLRNKPKDLTKYLKEWFQGCQPSWQNLITEFNWHRIWTLNIDDVIENAYIAEGRPAVPISWNDRFSDRDSTNAQHVIHLHGLASHLNEEGSNDGVLVFSIAEYASAVANPRTWHRVFMDEFAGRPFLVIGARLLEEFDLAEVLERGSAAEHSTGYPSVVVLPSISLFQREQLENAGLTVVEDRGEDFLRSLVHHYRKARSEFDEVYGKGTPGIRRFQQQFIDLRKFAPHDLNTQDFYSGYEPTWNTVQQDDDAMLDKTKEASENCVDISLGEDVNQRILLLTGAPGSGKSTGLLRIANDLIGAGTNPFLFRGDEYLDIEATVEWLKAVPRTVLLVDDSAEFSSTIQQFSERCKSENVRMLLVCSDRSSRLELIRDRIDPEYLVETYWYGNLTEADVDRIINKLHNRGRLGQITRLDRRRKRAHFVESAGRRLFDAMSELEGGVGFKTRAEGVYRSLPTERLKSLYAAACMCYEHSIPLPVGIGANLAGVPPRDLSKLIERHCNGILLLTRKGIRPPHRITASLVVSTLRQSERSDISLSLAKALAPHVDLQAMRAGTGEYRIVRYLMDQDTVSRLIGRRNARVWYEELREFYGWNGRYWDQRALLESNLENHETARSYAERSIQVHSHSFGYNTLGTVLLRMAIKLGSGESLVEGIGYLERARDFRNWGEREHPFVTFFSSLIRFAEAWGIDAVPSQARTSWNQWSQDAQSSTLFAQRSWQIRLNEWRKRWLMLAVSS